MCKKTTTDRNGGGPKNGKGSLLSLYVVCAALNVEDAPEHNFFEVPVPAATFQK